MKRAAFVAAALAAWVGAALLVRAWVEREEARPESIRDAPIEAATSEALRDDADLAVPASEHATERSADVASDARRAAVVDARAAPNSGAYHAEGTLVGIEVDGSRAEGLDGHLSLAFHGANGLQSGAFPVRGGRWRVLVPEGTSRLVVEAAHLGGRHGELAVPWSDLPARDGVNEIRITLEGSWLLHVVDGATGVPLERVEVRLGELFSSAFVPADAGRLPLLAGPSASPLIVAAPLAQARMPHAGPCYVGQAGFAWQRIDLDPQRRGVLTVRLARAGALEVTVEGGDAELRLEVGVFQPVPHEPRVDARLFGISATLPRERLLRFEALPVGHHVVVVGVGRVLFETGSLARGEIDITADRTATLTLTLVDPPLARPVPFAGTLHVPAGWSGRKLGAQLWRVGRAPDGVTYPRIEFEEVATDGARAVHFASPGLAPGPYSLVLWGLPAVVEVEVPPEGDSAAMLAVPPPRRVLVSLADGESGAARHGHVMWFPIDARMTSDGPSGVVSAKPDGGHYVIDGPTGALRVTVESAGYLDAAADVPASDEPVTELTIALRPARGLRLRHEHDGDVVFVTGLEWPTCHALPGGELVEPDISTRTLDALAEIEILLPPGRYRVQPQPPSRYQRPEPFEIEVPEVGFALHTVHLVRRP